MTSNLRPSETKVLAVASHVSYGYVGNTMATFVMQYLGCEVCAINTVYFSNHTAYKNWKGRRVPAGEIQDLYDGLKENNLTDFDMMLSGYIASKEAVKTVGQIGRDLRLKCNMKPGSFFWILDPVMGDEGRLYVAEEIVPAYKSILREADLILPNCFEAELLTDMKIIDMDSLCTSIAKLHQIYQVPHVIVTSARFSKRTGKRDPRSGTITVVGSSCRSDFTARLFTLTLPSLPVFFSGTGDMFAALMIVRLRAAVSPEMLQTRSWSPPDHTQATSLPLARACARVLATMQEVLKRTIESRDEELKEEVIEDGGSEHDEKEMHLRRTKASEVRVVKCAQEGVLTEERELEIRDVEWGSEAKLGLGLREGVKTLELGMGTGDE